MKKIASILVLALILLTVPSINAQAIQTKLMVEQITTEPSEVQPGEEFKLNFHLKNNGSRTLEKVFITLVNVEGKETLDGFSPIGSTNEIYVGTIAKGKTITKSFSLMTSPNMEIGTYNLVFKLNFKEKNYRQTYEETKTMGLLLQNKAKLLITNLNLPNNEGNPNESYNEMGSASSSSVEFVNAGKSLLSNVMVTLNTNGEESNKFYGDLDVGEQDFIDLDIPTDIDVDGKVQVSYTDSMNREGKVTKEFKITAPDETEIDRSKETEKKGFFAKIGSFFKGLLGLG